jgi:hypothetical protein
MRNDGDMESPPCLPADVGKSSLCKILLNYAVRAGWAPTFADMDIGQGSVTVPGSIAATPGGGGWAAWGRLGKVP